MNLPASDIEIYPAIYGIISNLSQEGTAGKFTVVDFEAKEVFV
jgi:hypothetical protein